MKKSSIQGEDSVEFLIPYSQNMNEDISNLMEKDSGFDYEIGLQSLEDAFLTLHEKQETEHNLTTKNSRNYTVILSKLKNFA